MVTVKTASIDTVPSFYIDEYPVYEVEGVVSITPHHTTFNEETCRFGWDVNKSTINNIKEKSYYMHIDTGFHDAFSHWVFESAVYLPLFLKLKSRYPLLKLLSSGHKNYKESFYRSFGVENDIVYTIENKSNIVFFPKYTTHHDKKIDNSYNNILLNFYNGFKKIDVEKENHILYLPRGVRENYSGNVYKIDCQGKLIEYFKNIENTAVYDSDNTINFTDQITLLRKSRKILLNYGSSFNVNSFFAENSEIYVLGFDQHHILFPILQMALNFSLSKGNKYTFIYKDSQSGNIHGYSFEKIIETISKDIVNTA